MGNGQSQQHFEDSPGYHVLRVSDNSPAEEAGLKSYFDFILSVNGVRLETDVAGTHLSEVLNHSVGETVVLNVYSSKERGIREVRVVPSKSWSLAETDGVIGAAVRFCSYGAAAENVWHILEVSPKSPAEKAGLQPNTDYVVGTPQMNLETQDDFFTLVEERQRAPIQLLVYNSQWDTCREVTIVPDSGWGGAGSLGCDIGYGYLHRVPGSRERLVGSEVISTPTQGTFPTDVKEEQVKQPLIVKREEEEKEKRATVAEPPFKEERIKVEPKKPARKPRREEEEVRNPFL